MEDEDIIELESLLELTNLSEESVRGILLFIRKRPSIEEKEEIKCVDVIKAIFSIADIFVKSVELFSVSPKVTLACKLCKIALAIGNFIFGQKDESKTLFRTLLDLETIKNARARLREFEKRLVYIQGVVDDITNATYQMDKDQMLGDVACEESVMAGIKDICRVEIKIGYILAKGDIGQFSKLMTLVDLYCCLISLHEWLLLYRIAILSSHNKRTKRLENVLQSHRKEHENILSFLHKPKREDVGFYLAFNDKNWPFTVAFLEQRGLKDRMRRELCKLLDGQVYEISSVRYTGYKLSIHDLFILTCARCDVKGDSPESLLKFQSGRNNTFVIKGNNLFLCNGLWVRGSDESSPATEWRIVRFESVKEDDEPCYLFASSVNNNCIRVDYTGRVYTTRYTPGNDKMLWKIKRK